MGLKVFVPAHHSFTGPEYLKEPYVVNYHFKKLPDGTKWNPTSCPMK